MLHHSTLDFFVCDAATARRVLAGYVEPDVLGEGELVEEECVWEVVGRFWEQGLVVDDWLFSAPGARVDHDAFLFVLPVDESQFFEFAAIVADGDDVSPESFGEDFVGDALGVVEDVLHEEEDLPVVVLVEIESQLL